MGRPHGAAEQTVPSLEDSPVSITTIMMAVVAAWMLFFDGLSFFTGTTATV
jgi:hypothetical protein